MTPATKPASVAHAIESAIHPLVFGGEQVGNSQYAVVKMDMEIWEALRAALPRAEALEAIARTAAAMLDHNDSGRTETRWTAKDSPDTAGRLANCDALRAALARLK